jgi:cysteine desulfurase
VTALSAAGFSVSTGSACHANETKPSRILLAMGRNEEESIGALRISMGRDTTKSTISELARTIVEILG